MTNMKSLQWIPRLLNAYIDAKVEYETNKKNREPNLQGANGISSLMVIPDMGKGQPEDAAPKSKRVQSRRSNATSKRKQVVRSVSFARSQVAPREELLLSRKHVERLEAIHQELVKMQRKVDRQLSLIQRNRSRKKAKHASATLTKFYSNL